MWNLRNIKKLGTFALLAFFLWTTQVLAFVPQLHFRNRPLTATNALGQQLFQNSYDPAGNLTNRSDAVGNSIIYRYDELNRLTERDGFNHEIHETRESFEYDAVGNILIASNATARLAFTYDVMDRIATATTELAYNFKFCPCLGGTTVTSSSGKVTLAPPRLSHSFFVAQPRGGLTTNHSPLATYTAAYAYDAGGMVTNMVFGRAGSPSPPQVTRTYDADGRLVAVSDWLDHTWTFAYDGAGKPTGSTSPGGLVSTNHYDTAGQLSAWQIGNLAGRAITRDAAGLKTCEDITAGTLPAPQKVRYADNTFDDADRLTSANVRWRASRSRPFALKIVFNKISCSNNLYSAKSCSCK